jgi:predicted  nucleic acid-binding Zn-ribbon protein
MVAKFKEWYPDMLNLPPPVVDPLSFPKTDEGLQALLKEIDRDCPLEGYSQTELAYHASNIHVSAGQTLDIPLPPVEYDGSKVEWSVTLVDEYHERLDIGFGLAVIVEGEETMVREMGRILAPVQSSKDGGGEDDATARTSGSTTNDVSAKGKFTVANSAPVGLVMKLDNSHAWIKPKTISYSFTIIPPIDENMIQRSNRAKSIVPKLLEGKKATTAAKENEHKRSEALGRIKKEMEEKVTGLSKQIDDEKSNIEEIQKSSDEAEKQAMEKANEIKDTLSMVKEETDAIDKCTSSIIALEEECARLKKQWEDLKVEKQAREEERLKLEQKAETSQKERLRLQEEIAAKKEEAKAKLANVQESEKAQQSMQTNLEDLVKEIGARNADEEKYAEEIKFLQKMNDAVSLRFIEPKNS